MMRLLTGLLCCLLCGASWAAEVRIAVASNFRHAAQALAERFEQQSEHRLSLSFGATGKHAAQISQGAPFDILLAADQARPELLERRGFAKPQSRFTYAVGRLVLWIPKSAVSCESACDTELDTHMRDLGREENLRFAVANPRHAPYGQAAMEVLQRYQWGSDGRIVMGENASQAFQFIASGNAPVGLVPRSLLIVSKQAEQGEGLLVPATWHSPILQQAVRLSDVSAAGEFMSFLKSPEALQLIRDYGYDTPDDD